MKITTDVMFGSRASSVSTAKSPGLERGSSPLHSKGEVSDSQKKEQGASTDTKREPIGVLDSVLTYPAKVSLETVE